jgi:hypothetical protein
VAYLAMIPSGYLYSIELNPAKLIDRPPGKTVWLCHHRSLPMKRQSM